MFTFINKIPRGFCLFVWQLDKCGGISGIIDKCHQYGIDGIFLKAADGNQTWAQASKANIDALHAAGIGVICWGYVYFGAVGWSTVEGEAAAAGWALDQGADGWLIDDEVECDGKPAAATQYCDLIRASHPAASLGYNPYPYPSSDVSHPFFEFNAKCDYCMPQLYQRQDSLGTPTQALAKMEADFAHWSPIWAARPGGRAAIPLLIDWQGASWGATPTPDSDITEAARVSAGKYPLISYWDMDSLSASEWVAIKQASVIFHGQESGMRQCRDIAVQSEFQGFNGDCTQDAFDTAAHSVDPAKYPVTGAELNALVHETQAAGEAGSSGAMNPAQLAWLCAHEGIAHHQLVTPDWNNLSAFTAWQDEVRAWGGIKPMIVQLAHGEWLPGSWSNPSGPAVGHAVALMGYDLSTHEVLLGDGNSSFGSKGQVSACPWATLVKVLPYALTVLDVAVPAQGGVDVAVVPVWDSAAGTLKFPAHDGLPEIVLEHAQAAFAKDSRVGLFPLTAAFYEGDDSVVLWSDCQKSVSVKAAGWAVHLASEAVDLATALKAEGQVVVLDKQIADLTAQLAAAKAAQGDPALAAAVKALLGESLIQDLLKLNSLAK